ncbi:MAG: hypothetical protein ACI8UR_001789 [Natronomonas sp.]|jgi:hypothetical protein|uniref:hypothetical protein n=1 Tax=Natronomonas sp. TaxID=2184060 RepID=UPI0039E23990
MSVARRTVERIRQPEYTGENRCLPCTATNLVIAAVVFAGVALVSVPVAIAVAALSVASIWLRGYLVPGTPELTKRYFPEWLLAKFDKQPTPDPTPLDEFNPEQALLEAGVVEPCADVDDLCLTEVFETTWRERMAALEDDANLRDGLAAQLDVDPETVTFESFGEAYVVRDGETNIGQWESRAAMLADLAAAKELPEWVTGWEALTPHHRSRLLGGLRVFIETCPTCGGAVTADTEIVESCCRSTTVVGVDCTECGDRLLEVPYDEAAA